MRTLIDRCRESCARLREMKEKWITFLPIHTKKCRFLQALAKRSLFSFFFNNYKSRYRFRWLEAKKVRNFLAILRQSRFKLQELFSVIKKVVAQNSKRKQTMTTTTISSPSSCDRRSFKRPVWSGSNSFFIAWLLWAPHSPLSIRQYRIALAHFTTA